MSATQPDNGADPVRMSRAPQRQGSRFHSKVTALESGERAECTTQSDGSSTLTLHETAEVVRVEVGLRKNASVARECLLAAIRTGDNRHKWSLAADIVAHAACPQQQRADANIISRQ